MRVLLILYVVFLGLLWNLQRSFVFFPQRLSGPRELATDFPARLVDFPSADGKQLVCLYAPPPAPDGPVFLIFHGNAGSIRGWSGQLRATVGHGYGGLLVDPQGYGWSEGRPSEKHLFQDARAAFDFLRAQGIAASRIVVQGISIGTGMAAWLAVHEPVRGLILQSAFTSIPAVAQTILPFVPCDLIFRDRFDNLARAPRIRCPVLLLHGREDSLVPPEQSQAIASALTCRKRLVFAPGYHHNDLGRWKGYWPTIRAFLGDLP